jgi:multidrug efflux pump subunit AcrA (membrane-fusion protein)
VPAGRQPGGPAKVDVASMFPSSVAAGHRHRVRRRARAAAVLLVVLAVGVAGAVVAVRASASGPAQYRTATASQRDVDAMLHGVATIEPVSQAAVAFPVSGTVASVAVTPGVTVTAGTPLASLDTTALEANLHNEQATLDQAKLTLQKALNGESVTTSSGARSFAMTSGHVTATLYGGLAASVNDDIAAAQQAVLAAQQQVDAARNHASAALASATTVCAAIGVDPATDPSGAVAALNACQTALQDVATAQTAVSDAQTALAHASSALDDLLDQLANQAPTTTTAPAPTTTTPEPTTEPTPSMTSPPPMTTAPPTTTTTEPAAPTTTAPARSTPDTSAPESNSGGARTGGSSRSSGSSGSAGRSTASASPTAADLVAYQSAVDAAAANVTMAEQALAQATVVSPIDGTVVAVNIAPGQSASAASTTQTVVVEGAGGFEATTTVSLDDVPSVKVGQHASVTADGATTAIDGSVVSISAVPASTTSTNYRVAIALPAAATGLLNGAIGSVAIMTGSAAGVAVPTSAVTTTGPLHTVRVVEAGVVRTVAVQVGVIGDTWTQVTGGLQAGEQVVLASVDEPLPSSATASTAAANRQGTNFPFGARIQRATGTP